MKDDKRKDLGITVKKEEDLGNWFSEVIVKSGFADYSPVKGCIFYLPPAMEAWNEIIRRTDEEFRKYGIKNVYLPLFIPKRLFLKEADHIKGFNPEVAWIENKENEEKLAIRPTSETLFSELFQKKVRSYRDLPLKYNQWVNIVRWETKAVKPFIRGREFLWQETHAVYATEEEARKDVMDILQVYKRIAEEVLRIPIPMMGRKTEKEKFAGAVDTYGIEGIMPDGKAIQLGTTHYLGTGFAKAFDITYLDEKNEEKLCHQTSWGISTRMIGAAIMLHSDNKGIVLPTNLLEFEVVIVPIIKKGVEGILDYSKKIFEELKEEGIKVVLDDRDISPGWKFNEWELKGVALRLEIGQKELKDKTITVAKRTGGKVTIKSAKEIPELLKKYNEELFKRAKEKTEKFIDKAKTKEEIIEKTKKGIVVAPFCGDKECEEKINELGITTRVIKEEIKDKNIKCPFCGKPAKYLVYFGRSY